MAIIGHCDHIILLSVMWHIQVCYLEFDRKDIPMNKMVVTSLESKFNVFDLRTQHPTKGFASLTEKVHTILYKNDCK